MIRERVSNTGVTRPLTPPSEIQALTMPREEIGKIKEGPAMRYINGQTLWDKKYRRTGERVKKRRERNLLQAHKAGEKIGTGLDGVIRESIDRKSVV